MNSLPLSRSASDKGTGRRVLNGATAAAPLALAEAADADEAMLERRIAVGKGTALAVAVDPR